MRMSFKGQSMVDKMIRISVLLGLSFLLLNSCELLYPPAYKSIVNNGTNSTPQPSGPKAWQIVGVPGVIPAAVKPLSLRVSSSGNPYVLTIGDTNVTYWAFSAGSWNSFLVTNYPPGSNVDSAVMTLANGAEPFIIVKETSLNSFFEVFTNTAFLELGYGSGFVSITSSNGQPAIAYYYGTSINLDYYNTVWISTNFTLSMPPALVDLQYSGGKFILMYQDSYQVLNMKTGTDLGSVAVNAAFPLNNVATASSGNCCFRNANGTAYVCYADSAKSNLFVLSYDGAATNSLSGIFSTNYGSKSQPSIAVQDANHIYIAYVDTTGLSTIKVFMYDGSTWNQLGSGLGTNVSWPSIDIAPNGTPYLAYIDNLLGQTIVQSFR